MPQGFLPDRPRRLASGMHSPAVADQVAFDQCRPRQGCGRDQSLHKQGEDREERDDRSPLVHRALRAIGHEGFHPPREGWQSDNQRGPVDAPNSP